MGTTTRIQSLCLLVFLVSVRVAAFELEDGKLSINGFGQWGYGWSNHGNTYSVAQPQGNFGNGSFALALAARLSDRAVAAAQLRMSSSGTTSLDWVFGEWRFSDRASLRVGIVKHPLGIFGEVPRVGTLRPFYSLPRGLYGSTELTGSGVEGLSLGGSLAPFGGWSLSYDVYGGSLKLPVNDVAEKLDPSNLHPGGKLVTVTKETKYIVGGRIVAVTPIDGLDLRLSSYGTPASEENGPRVVVGPSIQYLGEKFSARGEYFFFYEQGDLAQDRQRAHTAYLEVAYFLTEQIQIGARAEVYRLYLLHGSMSSLLQHNELAATLNYWFTPGWVVKASVHAIDGNRFATPLALDDALLAGGIYRQTLAVILGSQFSF